MKYDDTFSEEQLNAFVDGELDPEERSQIYRMSEQSADLDQRLCQQRKLKGLIAHAYEAVPEPKRARAAPLIKSGWFARSIAASVLLLVGVSLGFFGERIVGGTAVEVTENDVSAVTATSEDNYILHVVSGETEEMYAALRKARHLLDSAEEGQFRQVEIVANERGLNLLRSDVTPFADEIASLQASDVVFYACSRTIERLEEKGVKVGLVPETNSAYTALDRVVLRMKDDWSYIKI